MSTEQPTGGALARRTDDTSLIRTASQFEAQLEIWRSKHFHVLAPFTTFSGLSPLHGLMVTMVALNPDPAGGDVYQDKLFCKDDEVAPAKVGLAKIAQAAGMSWITERKDPRTIQNLWEVMASVRYVGLAGTPEEKTATEELDLRDGSDRSRKVMGREQKIGALQAARAKGLRNCEARAINAAIRAAMALQQKYHKADLLKPFVCVRVVPAPDMSNPLDRQMVLAQALGGVNAMFPHARPTPAPDRDVIDVFTGDTPAQPALPPMSTKQLVGHLVTEVTADIEAGTTDVSFDDGTTLTTRDPKVAAAAARAKREGAKVLPQVEEEGDAPLVGLTPMNDAPSTSTTSPSTADDAQLRIKDVNKVPGNGPKGPWMRYDVTLSNGAKCGTFDKKLHAVIDDAIRQNAVVKVTLSDNGQYDDKLDAIEIVDSRQQRLY